MSTALNPFYDEEGESEEEEDKELQLPDPCRTVAEGWGATISLNLPTSTWLTHGKITKTSL